MITRNDALSTMNQKFAHQSEALESRLDNELKEFDGTSILVDLSKAEFAQKVIEAVANKYRNVGGWTVEVGYGGQLDWGPFMKFS